MNTLIIDGNNLSARAYHTGNRFGFFSMAKTIIEEIEPALIYFVFDSGEKSWRHQVYPEYKAKRVRDPELSAWNTTLRKAFIGSNFNVICVPEADDAICTLTAKLRHGHVSRSISQSHILMVSNDKDLYQLLDFGIKQLVIKQNFSERSIIGRQKFVEEYDFEPWQYVHYKALTGDASDNIPGCPGIGPVAATKLIKEFGTVDLLYEAILQVKPTRLREKLNGNREIVLLSKKLSELTYMDDLLVKNSQISDWKVSLDFVSGNAQWLESGRRKIGENK